jgi:hypothetical protein
MKWSAFVLERYPLHRRARGSASSHSVQPHGMLLHGPFPRQGVRPLPVFYFPRLGALTLAAHA